jgi:hypothetical protein
MNSRDPMTFRANIDAYRFLWRNEKVIDEVLLDRGTCPGSSGSPIFLPDGRVIGILIAVRTEDGTAMTSVRPVLAGTHLDYEPREEVIRLSNMAKALAPFRFVLITVAGWMNQRHCAKRFQSLARTGMSSLIMIRSSMIR